jgi:uncharacterized protein YndB with AHSA1/START domain
MQSDAAHAVGAVVREVRSRQHEGRPAKVVVATRSYDTDIDDLWDALTNPERIPRWFLPISGELKLGGRYQFQGNAGGTITRCEPPRRLEATWEFGGGVSWLTVMLDAESAQRTRLQLEHMAHVEEHWEKFGPGAVGVGWELGLMGLERHVESRGAPVDPAAAMAWQASEQGKAFMRASSEGWGRAAIASGEDPDMATAAAARTTAFYLGEPPPS